jgi:hypothetical protein
VREGWLRVIHEFSEWRLGDDGGWGGHVVMTDT